LKIAAGIIIVGGTLAILCSPIGPIGVAIAAAGAAKVSIGGAFVVSVPTLMSSGVGGITAGVALTTAELTAIITSSVTGGASVVASISAVAIACKKSDKETKLKYKVDQIAGAVEMK